MGQPFQCSTCGRTHPRGCRGHRRLEDGTLQPCGQHPAKGGTVCRYHGGGNARSKAANARRVAEQRAERELRRLLPNVEPVVNPLLEFQMLAGRVKAWAELLEGKVAALDDWRYEDAKGAEQLRSEVALFERALAECRQVLSAYVKADVDDRLARVDETIGRAVVDVIVGTLTDLQLDAAVQERARQIAAQRLAAIEAKSR